jgi:ABC-type branched-subunit amino acid transport system ATPase component
VIELLGIGLRSPRGEWLLRRVGVRLETPELTFVVSDDRHARVALLDVMAARQVAEEGRAWLGGRPVTRETASTIAARVADVELHTPFVAQRSLVWNLLPPHRWSHRIVRALFRRRHSGAWDRALRTLQSVGLGSCADKPVGALDDWRRRRLSLARALMRQPDYLLVREIDEALPPAQAADVLGVLRTLAHVERLPIVVSTADPMLVYLFADRVLTLAGGRLVFNGSPGLAAAAASAPKELAPAG